MFKENFHTHTVYCDGKNKPSEMAEAAVKLGFSALGFSGHACLDMGCSWAMTREDTLLYIGEINSLKEKYKGVINIYCGTELDYFSENVPGNYDYTIGSVHYIKEEDGYFPVDSSIERQQECADRYMGGSLIKYAEKYYEMAGEVLEKTNADIIGHFDLVTKFNENNRYFDTSDGNYIRAWQNAADRLLEYNRPFEINTGAIARGKRITPYPALDIAEYINSRGGYFIVTSDCHDCTKLDCAYDMVKELYGKYNIISFEEYLANK